MRSVRITTCIRKQVLVPFASIIYPRDKQAFYQGSNFGGKSITDSVHYRSCKQITAGEETKALHYYQWTLEKLTKFGTDYERFLFAKDKGCGIDSGREAYFDSLDKESKHIALAEATTLSFCELFKSITEAWNPELASREVEFYRLLNNRLTIDEGRHRVAILVYKYGLAGYDAFETDSGNLKGGYYRIRLLSKLRKVVRKVTGRT